MEFLFKSLSWLVTENLASPWLFGDDWNPMVGPERNMLISP